jgi:hypothetical protein
MVVTNPGQYVFIKLSLLSSHCSCVEPDLATYVSTLRDWRCQLQEIVCWRFEFSYTLAGHLRRLVLQSDFVSFARALCSGLGYRRAGQHP